MNTSRLGTVALAVTAVAVFALSGFALAQGPGAGGGRGGGRGPGPQAWSVDDAPARGIERLAARLDLSEDQVKAITAIQEESRAKNQTLRKDLLRLQHDLRGEMLKDAPDEKTAAGLVEKIGDLRTQMQINRLNTRLAVRQQLTPEQRDKMLLSDGGPRRGERGGRWGRGARHGHGPGRGCSGDCPRFDD